MPEDLLDYWLRIITPIFPAKIWIVSRFSNGGHFIQIDWRLENDPHQTGKRSRKIEIIIPEETIDAYLDKNKAERKLSDVRMKQWISERYNHFNPDHDGGISSFVSAEKWIISMKVLNS